MSCDIDGVWNVTADQGASFMRTLTLRNSAKAPVNIAGMTGRMHVRTKESASTTVLVLTTENGGMTITGTTGEIKLYLTPTQTASVSAGTYVYDLELAETSTGIVTRITYGTFTLRPEVTR